MDSVSSLISTRHRLGSIPGPGGPSTSRSFSPVLKHIGPMPRPTPCSPPPSRRRRGNRPAGPANPSSGAAGEGPTAGGRRCRASNWQVGARAGVDRARRWRWVRRSPDRDPGRGQRCSCEAEPRGLTLVGDMEGSRSAIECQPDHRPGQVGREGRTTVLVIDEAKRAAGVVRSQAEHRLDHVGPMGAAHPTGADHGGGRPRGGVDLELPPELARPRPSADSAGPTRYRGGRALPSNT